MIQTIIIILWIIKRKQRSTEDRNEKRKYKKKAIEEGNETTERTNERSESRKKRRKKNYFRTTTNSKWLQKRSTDWWTIYTLAVKRYIYPCVGSTLFLLHLTATSAILTTCSLSFNHFFLFILFPLHLILFLYWPHGQWLHHSRQNRNERNKKKQSRIGRMNVPMCAKKKKKGKKIKKKIETKGRRRRRRRRKTFTFHGRIDKQTDLLLLC